MDQSERVGSIASSLDPLLVTVELVGAYLRNNAVPPAEVPALITAIHKAVSTLGAAPERNSPAKPAVPIRQSIKTNYLICLEDGVKLKTLKRHLRTKYGMSPSDYRRKWGLPADYPMVAPAYTAQRSQLAKKAGLGRRSSKKKRARGEAARAAV